MHFGRFRAVVAAVTFLMATFTLSWAQTQTTGSLSGTVTDSSGAIVAGAKVQIKSVEKGSSLDQSTSANGGYSFNLLNPGNYQIRVEAKGFQASERTVSLAVGQAETVNMKLAVGSVSETVVVTEQAPLLQTDDANMSTAVSEEQVQQMPNPGNDLSYIAQIAPGTVMNTQGGYGNFSAYGLPATSNLFTLNGMDDNDPFLNLNNSGATNLLLGANEVQEASVVANGYTGQYGTLAGSNVNYVTMSGGNQFHGNAKYYWNGRVMNANDYFNMNTQPGQAPAPRPFDNANQWAARFGGPIVKDKLFFFVNTEGLRVLLPVNSAVNIPSPAFQAADLAWLGANMPNSVAFYKQIFGLYNGAAGAGSAAPGNSDGTDGCRGYTFPGFTGPCTVNFRANSPDLTHEWQLASRVDWNISDKDRAFIHYLYDHGLQASYTDPINPIFNAISDQPQHQGQINETHTFSPTTTNQFIVSGAWYSALFSNASLTSTLNTFPTTLLYGDGAYNNLGGEDFIWPQGRNVTQYQISDDFTKIKGNHTLKVGLKFRRNDVSDHDYGFFASGYMLPVGLDSFFYGGTSPAGDPTVYIQSFPKSLNQPMALWGLGGYVEDDWKVKSNFTLTASLRVEHQANPVCQTGCFALLNGDLGTTADSPSTPYNSLINATNTDALNKFDNVLWQPRLGFAWSPRGGKYGTVIRGGIGIFYDAFPGNVVDSFSSNAPLDPTFTIVGGNISPSEANASTSLASASNQAFQNGFSSGASFASLAASVPGFAAPSLAVAENHTFAPLYQKWNLEVEQSMGENTVLSVDYVGNHGMHELVANNSMNAFGFGGLRATAPYPSFGEVTEYQNAGVSNYNGLTTSVTHRWGHGVVQANYTWSHAFDDVSNGGLLAFAGGQLSPQNPYDVRGNYGPSDYDVRHSFNANYVWELPVKWALGGHGWNPLVNGWQISGAVFARSGLPFSIVDGSFSSALNGNNYYSTIYAQPVTSVASSCSGLSHVGNGPNGNDVVPCWTPSQFVPSGMETGFEPGLRNAYRGPNYFDTDMTVMKYTQIRENMKFALGFQFFNLFNHPNFGLPGNNITGSLGTIQGGAFPPTSILGSFLGGDVTPRMIQLKAELTF